jgi:hypothetical protein
VKWLMNYDNRVTHGNLLLLRSSCGRITVTNTSKQFVKRMARTLGAKLDMKLRYQNQDERHDCDCRDRKKSE